MLEIFFLCLVGAALAKLARLRGGRGWPWVVVMVLVYIVAGNLGAAILTPGLGSIVGGAFIVPLFLLVFLFVGGGRRAREPWQCPACQLFNNPTTLVCPCGYRLEQGPGRPPTAPVGLD